VKVGGLAIHHLQEDLAKFGSTRLWKVEIFLERHNILAPCSKQWSKNKWRFLPSFSLKNTATFVAFTAYLRSLKPHGHLCFALSSVGNCLKKK
jgi:hypothetical protein